MEIHERISREQNIIIIERDGKRKHFTPDCVMCGRKCLLHNAPSRNMQPQPVRLPGALRHQRTLAHRNSRFAKKFRSEN